MTDPMRRLEQFQAALKAVHGECLFVGPDWPRMLADLLRAGGIQRLWYHPADPHGAELATGWPAMDHQNSQPGFPLLTPFDQPIETCHDALFADRCAGFTTASAGIAETGSVVLRSAPTQPRSLSLAPEVHCVMLNRSAIIPTLDEWMTDFIKPDFIKQGERLSTNLLIVTGPSKSADIEQTLTLGVHGPKRLLVLLRD